MGTLLFSQYLLDPRAYPHFPASVELIQTHISWVYLTGDLVYKVKKPVNLGFLDYTAPELRRYFCHQEVKLNRRLCPGIYLGVVPVTKEKERLAFEGKGKVVDYAVKMVQMPTDRMMDLLLEQDRVREAEVEEIAKVLAKFHLEAETGGPIDRLGDPSLILSNINENFEQTQEHLGVTIAPDQYYALKQWSYDFIQENQGLFRQRITAGKIRDCHGDVHSRNICLGSRVYIYDCIEFNERFRYGDVASEVAFLAMDLEFHRASFLARVLVDKYLELTGDKGLLDLLDFYKIYRAYVRGKIHSFLIDEEGVALGERWYNQDLARGYFRLAENYLRDYKRPMLIITTGLMGSGKTQLAHRLSAQLGAEVISSDEVRKKLAGARPRDSFLEPYGQGIYSPEFSRRTYEEILRQADYWLGRREPVIIDATFARNEERIKAAQLAQKRGADFYVLHCRCSPEELLRRLKARFYQQIEGAAAVTSDGRPELLPRQTKDFEAFQDLLPRSVIDINTEKPEEQALESVLQALSKKELPLTISNK